ncbi:hypothetical protein SRHO_G00202560 [Serrasalmus rhombeus]
MEKRSPARKSRPPRSQSATRTAPVYGKSSSQGRRLNRAAAWKQRKDRDAGSRGGRAEGDRPGVKESPKTRRRRRKRQRKCTHQTFRREEEDEDQRSSPNACPWLCSMGKNELFTKVCQSVNKEPFQHPHHIQ